MTKDEQKKKNRRSEGAQSGEQKLQLLRHSRLIACRASLHIAGLSASQRLQLVARSAQTSPLAAAVAPRRVVGDVAAVAAAGAASVDVAIVLVTADGDAAAKCIFG